MTVLGDEPSALTRFRQSVSGFVMQKFPAQRHISGLRRAYDTRSRSHRFEATGISLIDAKLLKLAVMICSYSSFMCKCASSIIDLYTKGTG